jgi:transposase
MSPNAGVERQQPQANEGLLLAALLPEDAQVRYIDAFVDRLDLAALNFQRVTSSHTGRPPYHPGDLLKLYMYGYLNHVRSSRRLEQETYRNVEVIWLIRKLHPDFKTIADFRKNNGQAIRDLCRLFTLMCRDEGLFGGQLLAIDGSKFKASNSKKRNFTESKIKRLIKESEKKIDEYFHELDRQDEKESEISNPTKEELRKKIDRISENLKKYLTIQQQMKETKQSQLSLTDPDSRAMYLSQAIQISYNVQFAVDAKHKMIVDHEVTNSVTDLGQLSPLALRAKNLLGVSGFELLADRGYYFGEQVKECVDSGIVPYIPKPNTSVNLKKKMFSKEHFTFSPETDSYRCPADKTLTYRFSTTERGRNVRYYIASRLQTLLHQTSMHSQ